MIYFDTSAVVPLILPEAASASLQRWLMGVDRTRLALSGWTTAEFASALGLRFRSGALTQAEAMAAWAEYRRAILASFAILPVASSDCDLAARLVLRFDLGLRAGDALHLAVAQNAGVSSIVTLDKRLAAATAQVGLVVAEPA